MDPIEEQEEEDEEFSGIIRIFERLTFERNHDIHDQVSSMIELFSSSDVTLDMLDTLIECVKTIFVHPHINKNMRILDFLIILTHVTHLNYTSNKNLSLLFDALIDILTQTMVAMDSQIRYTTLRILNKLQSFIDLSQSPYLPDQFEQYLLDSLNNEPTLQVLDEVISLAAKFQHRNERFIQAFLSRLTSSKWLGYSDRRRQVISILHYSRSSLDYLLDLLETDHEFFQITFESLLSDERGFTLETIGTQGRSILFKLASTSRDLSRFIFTRWINQNGGRELVDILRICQISTANDRMNIEKALRYFLADENIRRIIAKNTKLVIGNSRGGLLTSTTSKFVEHLFIWRLLCQLQKEEDDDDEDDINIHPDFHELIAYFYRLIKSSVNERLSTVKEFTICQYASILSTFDLLDAYRRKCLEATGRCMLVHFGQYESLIEQAYQFIQRIHPSSDTNNERYQLITYTLNDIIQRCQNEQSEKLAFIQCMTIVKVFVEQEKQLQIDQRELKQLIDSLIRSGLSNGELDIQIQTLTTLHSLMCHCRPMAIEYFKQILHINNQTNHLTLKCASISTLINVLLIYGLDILIDVNLMDFIPTEYFLRLLDDRNIELQTMVIFGLIKLFLSGRLQATTALLKAILDYRFSNDLRSIRKQQREEITVFFYFFIHQSISNVILMEELTFNLVSRSLPRVSDGSTIAYQSILIEPMCHFCVELLSLPTLPKDQIHEEHSHFHLAKNLLQLIHQSTNHRTVFIVKTYLDTIKHLQYQYMNREQLEILFDLIVQLRQYPNLTSVVLNAIKHMEEQIQSNVRLIDKLTNGNKDDKRPRSPSPSSSTSVKRISSSFNPSITSSPRVLQDRTNQMSFTNDKPSSSKGIKRKSNTHRYATLDFDNDTEEFF